MISVLLKVDMDERNLTSEIYKWLGTYVNDHCWAVTRLTVDAIKVDFFGSNQKQAIVAFKLKFGGP